MSSPVVNINELKLDSWRRRGRGQRWMEAFARRFEMFL